MGVLGFETNTDRELTKSGQNLTIGRNTGVSIGAIKFSDESVETFSNVKKGYIKTGEASIRTTTFGKSKSIKLLV